MSRQVLACHVYPSRPGKIVVQEGGPMPECRDLQSGNLGYYEWIEAATLSDTQRIYSQLEPLTIIASVVLSALVTVAILFAKSRK